MTDKVIEESISIIANALQRIADNWPGFETLRTDHPLQGQTFSGIESGLSGMACAVESIADEMQAANEIERVKLTPAQRLELDARAEARLRRLGHRK